jgi:hypothetical protein
MTEWAEGEDDPDSYEIPKLEQDLPPCLKDKQRSDRTHGLSIRFPAPAEPMVERTWSKPPSNYRLPLDRTAEAR